MNGQYFADTGVVVPYLAGRIPFRIEIAHAAFRTAYERAIAEDDPRLLGTLEERLPEYAKSRNRCVRFRELGGLGCVASTDDHYQCDGEDDYKRGDCHSCH